ncbi:serine--tRNA ligase [Patescibacteria group bacterium]|nr:serine--tRNA ligase [Patescibacteria group bacterium]
MLDIKTIRDNPEKIRKACQDKQAKVDIDKLLTLDTQRRKLIKQNEILKAEHNQISKKIASLKGEEKQKLINHAKEMVNKIGQGDKDLGKVETEFQKIMFSIPNPALPDVKVGKDEAENEVLFQWGKIPKFTFKPKDHLVLGEDLDLIDIQRAGKVSGTRFAYLKNELALLEYGLVQFVFDYLTNSRNIKKTINLHRHGGASQQSTISNQPFVPVVPPAMIKQESMKAMGYLERGEDEVYQTKKDNFYLVGTSEQSIGPMHTNEILDKKDLPKRYVSFSTCFRREAGSYGKDVKGILRVHQFDKVEMFSFCSPEKSTEEHKFILSLEEKLVQALKIPYQVVKMCTGDLGYPAASKYDIECWMPGQDKYRETHSTSNCTDFQARRLNIRFRSNQEKIEFVHTLNGTAFAIGRILIAIMENYQQKDGSIKIPKVLQKYTGLKQIKKRK